MRGAEDVQLHQDSVHQEEPGPREQDPEGQAAAETIKDGQQLRQDTTWQLTSPRMRKRARMKATVLL